MIRTALAAVALLVLAGCTQITLVKGGESVTIAETLSVRPAGDWTRITGDNQEVWTVDGPTLEELIVVPGAVDGEPLYHITHDGKVVEDLPPYRKGMTGPEIAELVEIMLARGGATRVKIDGLRPAIMATASGVRFEFTYTAESGLDMAGMFQGAEIDGKMFIFLFSAPALHYFPTYRDRVEALLQSVRRI